jgi:hypothetical protein
MFTDHLQFECHFSTWLQYDSSNLRTKVQKFMKVCTNPSAYEAYFFNSYSGGGGVESKLGPLCTSVTSGLLYVPRVIVRMEFGGMKIGRGHRSTRRKPTPTPLCTPQIPLDQTRARTRPAALGSQRLTAWAMARPIRRIQASNFVQTSYLLPLCFLSTSYSFRLQVTLVYSSVNKTS